MSARGRTRLGRRALGARARLPASSGLARQQLSAALTRRGCREVLAGRIEPALVLFRRAIASAPNFLPAYLNLGFLASYAEPAEMQALRQELARALPLFPGAARLHLHLAELSEALGELAAAAAEILRAARADPQELATYDLAARPTLSRQAGLQFRRAFELLLNARLRSAEAALQRRGGAPAENALRLNLARACLARARFGRGRPEDLEAARRILSELVVQLHAPRELLAARLLLADTLERLHRREESEHYLVLARESALGQKDYHAAFEHATFLFRTGELSRAIAEFKRATELAPLEASTFQALRLALLAYQRIRAGEENFARAGARPPFAAYCGLLNAYLAGMKLREAERRLEEALAIWPRASQLWMMRAWLLRKRGGAGALERAEAAARRARALAPREPESHRLLGGILLERGRLSEGLRELKIYQRLARGREEG